MYGYILIHEHRESRKAHERRKIMYMSYCRYEGTLDELRACLYDVMDHIAHDAEYPVSDRQIQKFREMVYEFHGFMEDNGLLDMDGDLDESALESICEDMATAADEEEMEEE